MKRNMQRPVRPVATLTTRFGMHALMMGAMTWGAAAGFGVDAQGQQTQQAKRGWHIVDPPMVTQWAKDVDPKMPLPEYPRPQLTRENWQNLNGLWQYAVVKQGQAGSTGSQSPKRMDGQILVPYPIESALSGVKRAFQPDEVLVYQRSFDVPKTWDADRIVLHFGAVDYRCEVFVNGTSVGKHVGGYDPFSFDITEALEPGGEQTVVVKVTDPTWTEGIPRGKQTLRPNGIMYTPTSGIWQTVWLEPVNTGAVEDLHIVPNLDNNTVEVGVDLYNGSKGQFTVEVEGKKVQGTVGETVSVPVANPELWTPDNPHLYDMQVSVQIDGEQVDSVGSYFGMRSVEMAQVNGETQVLLNGQPFFMFGPLDQGFWPEGCYTAPTDEALRYDLEVTKQLGFNGTRKHIKVEPARWYYHADQLGLVVWQDMPSTNSYDAGDVPGGAPSLDRRAYRTQLAAMMDNLENHPSIITWVVFNESQGKHDTESLVKLVRDTDPSRLVNEDSGFFHGYIGCGDFHDRHPYPAPAQFDDVDKNAFALGEYGGIGLKLGNNNPWQSKGWGYTNTESGRELEDLYARYCGMLKQYKENDGLTAAIYTQITDVEIEINGLMTYDRKLKVDPEWIAKATHFEWTGPTYTSIVPTAKEADVVYQYTFDRPNRNWMRPRFNPSGWREGQGGFGTRITPGGKIGTEWNTPDIWARRTFTLPALTAEQLSQMVLNVHHDEDVTVYINGVLALKKDRWESNYVQVPMTENARRALKPGQENVLAIHCHQTDGGQYVDVGLGTLKANRQVSNASENEAGQTAHHFERTVSVDQSVEYLLHLPTGYDAERSKGYPLMLFLHGAGERGDNLEQLKTHGPPKIAAANPDFPFVLVSPQCPRGKTWDVSTLDGLLDDIMATHNIDPSRVYLTGLSMGGYGTWALGSARPDRFAAIVPICGGGSRLQALLPDPAMAEALRSLPVWVFHGGKDGIVPLSESEKMIDAFKRAGVRDIQFTVYPEAGHDSWTETYANPELYTWLLSKHR